MTLNLTAPPPASQLKPRIVVVGVGGAGSNAVNNMIASNLEGVEFVVANTDAQSLAMNASERRIQLGANITNGLGAGARPDIGRAAAEEALDEIIDHLQGSHMAFIAAGMGGGTGTGAAPVIARAAREQGILTVGVVTKPFQFEGAKRMRQADEGIAEMAKYVDTMIVVPNERLLAVVGKGIPFQDALKKADEVLLHATGGISGIITKAGLVNVDFADVRTVMKDGGSAIMGTGIGRGENRAVDAAKMAIESPLLDNVSIAGARGVLINITAGTDTSLDEYTAISDLVRTAVGDDAEIIFGAMPEPAMQGEVRVTVIATGFNKRAASQPPVIGSRAPQTGTPVIPLDPAARATRPSVPNMPAAGSVTGGNAVPAPRPRPATPPRLEDLSDLEIPTFIRRQMD